MSINVQLTDKLEEVCSDAMDSIYVMAKKALVNGGDHHQTLKHIAEYARFCRDDIFRGFTQLYR